MAGHQDALAGINGKVHVTKRLLDRIAAALSLYRSFAPRNTAVRRTMNSSDSAPQIREEILRLVSRYHEVAHAPKPFVPGETKIPYAGRVYDDDEMRLGVDSILQFWLTAGPFANQFEKQMRDYFGSNA